MTAFFRFVFFTRRSTVNDVRSLSLKARNVKLKFVNPSAGRDHHHVVFENPQGKLWRTPAG